MDPLDQLDGFLACYPESIRTLAQAARLKVRERLWPVTEIYWDATNAVCLGFTHTESVVDNFFNFAVYANHVTLIFPWGVNLADPESRLRGEGKRVRNLRLETLESLDDPYVWGLVLESEAIAKRPATPCEPTVIVKVMNGPKKRPKTDGA